jgi:acyl-CoA thioesterase YciA
MKKRLRCRARHLSYVRSPCLPMQIRMAIFLGGWLMSQMDLAAASVAARVSRGRVATVHVEEIEFRNPVFVGDEMSLFAHLISRGRTSMKIEVEAWRRSREGEVNIKVTEAVFVCVAIGENLRPRPLPA